MRAKNLMCKTQIVPLTDSHFEGACAVDKETQIPWKAKLLKQLLYGKDSCSYAAVVNDKVIGYACIKLGKTAIINTIAVNEKHRRKGIGQLLLAAVMCCAYDKGVTSVALKTAETNKVAIDLYSKIGFKSTGVIRDYYGESENAVVMSCTLAGHVA